MRKLLPFVAATLTAILLLAWPHATCNAQDEDATVKIASFLDSNTIGYLHADLQEFDFAKAFDLLTESGAFLAIWNAASLREEIQTMRPLVLGTIELLKKKGAKDAYIFFNLSDPMGSSIIVPGENEKQARKFKSVFPMGELVANNLVIGRKGSVQKILDFGLPKRYDAEGLLEIADGHKATIVISPSEAHTRVMREVMPSLPKPLDDVTGDMLAEGLFLTVITIDSLEPIEGKMQMVSKTEGSSKALAAECGELFEAMASGQIELTPGTKELVAQMMKTFKPQQAGKIIELTLQQSDFDELKSSLAPLLAQASTQSAVQTCSNNLRQLALALLNQESATRRFAGYANFDKDGKPLLGWRVHILPFLGEGKLYKKFHLDEPWDSPHNIELAKEIPDVYRVPKGWANDELTTRMAAEGKTVFVMPRGNGMFGTKEGMRIQDVTDGTSNTIMLITVQPDAAVVWTKPEDIEIDPENPKEFLFSKSQTQVPVTFCDSSSHVLSEKVDGDNLRRLLQFADGEIVESGNW